MLTNKTVLALCCALLLGLSGCSRQQSDWQKTRESNTTDAYEQFVKKYPSGEFTVQAEARLKGLYEERDWQKARDTDTAEAYQAFLKQYPDGKWTEEARIRVENFTLAQTPTGPGPASGGAGTATGGATGSTGAGGAASGVSPTAPSTGPSTPPAPATAAIPQAQKPKPRASAPGTTATEGPVSAEGGYAIQLGAFKSGSSAANKRWARLKKEYPSLFKGLSSKVVQKRTPSGVLFRLQAVGVSEKHARGICKSLRAHSQPCVVVRPTRA
jgi:cell division protein FtsN